MARFCSVVASLALGALTLAPTAPAAPPGNASCMAAFTFAKAQSQIRDDLARIVRVDFAAPGRDYYSVNAVLKSTDSNCFE